MEDPAIGAQWNFVGFYSIGVESKNIPPWLADIEKMRHKCIKSWASLIKKGIRQVVFIFRLIK
jgi:hypothetical protein